MLHAYIFVNIRFSNKNDYLLTKEMHIVRTMEIIVYTKRTLSGSLVDPKTSSPSKYEAQFEKEDLNV